MLLSELYFDLALIDSPILHTRAQFRVNTRRVFIATLLVSQGKKVLNVLYYYRSNLLIKTSNTFSGTGILCPELFEKHFVERVFARIIRIRAGVEKFLEGDQIKSKRLTFWKNFFNLILGFTKIILFFDVYYGNDKVW